MPFYENSEIFSGGTAEFFEQNEDVFSQRKPCPICGHPTGDCTGDSPPPKKIAFFGASETLKAKQKILIEEDIYEDRQITPNLSIKVLIHKKGKYVSYEIAERLGLI
jgi:hypothetical protein